MEFEVDLYDMSDTRYIFTYHSDIWNKVMRHSIGLGDGSLLFNSLNFNPGEWQTVRLT